MELQSIVINGFRRFAEETELRTHGKLVAILGPNEAGKTSLLRAIVAIGNSGPFQKSDLTRGKNFSDDHIILKAKFRLEKNDLEAAKIDKPTYYIFSRSVSGEQIYEFDPPLSRRDTSGRAKIVSLIDRIRGNQRVWEKLQNEIEDISDTFDNARRILASDAENLDDNEIEYIKNLSNIVDSLDLTYPKYVIDLISLCQNQAKFENAPSPEDYAEEVIYELIPKILFFSNADRLLEGSYDINEISPNIPAALDNLAKIAKLNLPQLISYMQDDDTPNIMRLKSQANDELKKRFSESWSQSGVHVAIETTGNEIQVLVREENYQFTKLAERSDGLRQFVALQAFTTCERVENPILLIDEAEMRLHYDAQADLIQMLSRQNVSPKIIYTTHSAGCLPEDLGSGVRLVDRKNDADLNSLSFVRNYFWNREEGGLSPLLYGMGAATLAFFPIRRALLTEGESDMLLLPPMFRETFQTQTLTFQIVPGLSKTSGINLPILARNGHGIAFALDSDKGAFELEKKILSAQFPKDSIFKLKSKGNMEHQIEDFINPKILAHAVNEALWNSNLGINKLSPSEFRSNGRLALIKSRFKLKNNSDIPKTLIAYKIVDFHVKFPDEPVVDPRKKASFEIFSQRILTFLQKAPT